jgi:hypothetical protein
MVIHHVHLQNGEQADLFSAVNTNIILTAEKGTEPAAKDNEVMSQLFGWFNANSLTLNTERTIATAFHNRQERSIAYRYMSASIWTGMHI